MDLNLNNGHFLKLASKPPYFLQTYALVYDYPIIGGDPRTPPTSILFSNFNFVMLLGEHLPHAWLSL